MSFLLWILAVVCLVFGVINLFSGAVLWGVVLIVVACILGGWGPFVGAGRG